MLIESNPAGKSIGPPHRDTVEAFTATGDNPRIVSVSDIHGYLEVARSALLTLRDHPDFPPVVVQDEDGRLHWANEDYVLVFNGDLVDRGPANDEVLELVSRLASEASPGRVRATLGNHEAIILSPTLFNFPHWYTGQVDTDQRRTFLKQILTGEVVAAYQGYNVTYAHAGLPNPYDVQAVNESLVAAAEDLIEAVGTPEDGTIQRRITEEYSKVLGVGETHLKGRGAGLVWLDFNRLPKDAPPQVVGHTRHDRPAGKGNVCCQNVIRNNIDSEGGEAVFVESPRLLDALIRHPDGDVKRKQMRRMEGEGIR